MEKQPKKTKQELQQELDRCKGFVEFHEYHQNIPEARTYDADIASLESEIKALEKQENKPQKKQAPKKVTQTKTPTTEKEDEK